MNARIDVSELLSDPDFAAEPGEVFAVRTSVAVRSGGRPVGGQEVTDIGAEPWSAVVIAGNAEAVVGEDGVRAVDTVSVYTTFPLSLATAATEADIVRWAGAEWRVTAVASWRHFGSGFVVATCLLRAPVEPVG